MAEKTDYEAPAANLLKDELKRNGITYSQLVEKPAEILLEENEVNVRNKISREKFNSAFLPQCLTEIGKSSMRIT
ncbi:MAG TPA: DUF6471 domain-containing protein [Rhizobiaceae bacterium]